MWVLGFIFMAYGFSAMFDGRSFWHGFFWFAFGVAMMNAFKKKEEE